MLKCQFENQQPASLRHVTVHALVVKDHRVLLVRRAPHLTNGNLLCFPGGFVDRDETIEEAALRELKEETGYDGTVNFLFSICDNPNRRAEDRQNVAFTFVVELGEKTGDPDKESTETAWFDLDRLPPVDEMAFDHLAHLQLYKDYLESPASVELPVFIHQ